MNCMVLGSQGKCGIVVKSDNHKIKFCSSTLVNVYVDLVVFTRIAGT